jgi:hypothetical protein
MRHKTGILALMVAILLPVVSLTMSTQAAWAVTCSGNLVKAAGYRWTHFVGTRADVNGVRAPIEVRTDGGLCNHDGHPDSADFTYIAIRGSSPSAYAELGLEKNWGCFLNSCSERYCHFWATGTPGGVFMGTDYACGDGSNLTEYFFTIHLNSNLNKYVLSDCGTSGGYAVSNCNDQNNQLDVFGDPAGIVAAQADYSCDLHIEGSQPDKQNVGTTSYHIQGLDDSFQWVARSWGSYYSDCSSTFIKSEQNGGETMKFYDTRNNG